MAGSLNTRTGSMRSRLVFSTIASTQETTFGSWTQDPTVNSTRWGSIEPISAREKLTAGQLVPEATHVVRVRYFAALVPSMTFTNKSRTFEVLSITNVNDIGKIAELLCKELV